MSPLRKVTYFYHKGHKVISQRSQSLIYRRISTCVLCALFASFSISSCSDDFLTLSPETAVTSGSYFKTKEHFDMALVACYESLRVIALTGMFMDELRADNCYFTRYHSYNMTIEAFCLFIDDENNTTWNVRKYDGVYSGIQQCNTILSRIDGARLTDAEKNPVIAETKFLRAFYYFDLVTHWGPVPLMINEVTTAAGAFKGNSTVEEIYIQILADVTDAIALGLPVAETFPQSGRVTMGAAKMLRAYANMSKPTRDYPAAEQDLKDIVNMNYELEDNFEDFFKISNKNGKESIFEVQYQDGGAGSITIFLIE